ncbi:MAG: creatininase family protein [Thermoproteota archaeon]|nr:MAG: creatininase family protein [Candidatus Korarchaeota archaeon]
MNRKVLLEEMTSEEAGKAIKEADFVILPAGSLEQHSLHLPLSTDSIRAEYLARYLAESSGDLKLVVLPTLRYGLSEHHIRFPGTITLKNKTYMNMIFEIALSLKRHGAKRLLVMNFHGGNIHAIRLALLRIEREIGLKTYFVHWTEFARDLIKEYGKDVPYGHSGFYETSMIMLFRPDLIREDKMRKQEYRGPPQERELPSTKVLAYFDQRYPTGGIGDPRLASKEFAEKLVKEVTNRILQALKEDLKYE